MALDPLIALLPGIRAATMLSRPESHHVGRVFAILSFFQPFVRHFITPLKATYGFHEDEARSVQRFEA